MAIRSKINKSGSQDLETNLLSWLESNSVDHTAEYISRGRRHLRLQDAELLEQWKNALRLMAADVKQPQHRSLFNDLGAEIKMRGIKEPFDEVREIFEAFQNAAAAEIERKLQDPDEASRINEEIVRDLEDFKKRSKDGN
jgi:hypothetical protein